MCNAVVCGNVIDAPPHPVILLIDAWLADESGYDEEVWPRLKAALEKNGRTRLPYREELDDV